MSCGNSYLISTQNNRDILTDTGKISVPVGNILVGDTRSDVEHDNSALPLDADEDGQSPA